MKYSKWELKEATLLIKKIGFNDEEKIEKILRYYYYKYGTEISYQVISYGTRKNNYKPTIIEIENNTTFKCLNLLRFEVDIRKKYNEIEQLKKNDSGYLSATDLASYVFCPASYSISKSFKIEHFLDERKLEKGNEHHNQLRFIKKEKFGFNDSYISKLNTKQKSIINKIKSCKLIYYGHGDDNKTFINQEKKFISKPDYIFIDPNNNHFVVEEKYHYQNKYIANYEHKNDYNKAKNFYPNNIIQLQSYIDYIKEFDIKYGIIINWYYSIKNDQLSFHDFTFKVIYKGNNNPFLETIFSEISEFKKKGNTNFNKNINLKKCLNCSVNLYCSHKTGNFDKLDFPYNIEDLKIIDIEPNIESENDKDDNDTFIPLV